MALLYDVLGLHWFCAGSSSSSGVIAGIAAGSGVLLLLLILGVVLCLRYVCQMTWYVSRL